MRTALSSRKLRIEPGRRASLDIEVTNTSDVIDGVTAYVVGLEPGWVQLAEPVISLFPAANGVLKLELNLPKSFPAGGHRIEVVVLSTVDPDRRVSHEVMLVVEPVVAGALQLRPSIVNAGRKGRFGALVSNLGNVPTEFSMAASDPARVATCAVLPATVIVPPGETATVDVLARGRRPFFAQTASRQLQVSAISGDLQLDETARFNQKPLIPRGFITILILVLIIALWATMFFFVVELLRGGDDAKKAVPDNWNNGGARHVLLTDIAGQIDGSVTAASTGQGLARITVEAYRELPPNRRQPDRANATGTSGNSPGTTDTTPGPQGELTGSAATDDDGNYRLGALLPGTYRLRFSAEGFEPVWYPGVNDPADAEAIQIQPLDELEGRNITIAGRPGTLVGNVAPPPGTTNAPPATVSVTLLPADGSPPGDPVVVQTEGPLEVGGLETPATYQVRVERAGFDVQTIEVELTGGSTTVLDTVQLTSASGGISGVVVDGSGTPLGGVTVMVQAGEDEREIITPTAGSVGTFVLSGLSTPNTYVLTFTLEGYSSATVALQLEAGQTRTGVRAELIGGLGSVRGTAVTQDGQPLGGVSVTVARSGFTARTATLTAGVGPTGVGTYSVTDIPTPGSFTVTFELAGYISETVPVTFAAAGLQGGVDVVMRPSAGALTGTITAGGLGVSGTEIVLSDGSVTRATVSATNPTGSYGFTGLPPGAYTLTVTPPPTLVGVPKRVVLVEVLPGETLVRDIPLAGGS